jgi:ABC-type transporter MlaC component
LVDRNGLAARNIAAGSHQQFRGLNNFTRAGFNRNAFGNGQAWNRWGGRFWGSGWNNWGSGWGGWAGPVFWPFLFGDIVSFVVYPYDYYDSFWAFGPDFILASIFAPGPYFGPDYGYWPDYYGYGSFPGIYYGGGYGYVHRAAKSRRLDRAPLAQINAQAVQSCKGLAPGVTDLPIEHIRQIVRPTAEQDALLGDLSSASSQASAIVDASCPKEVPLTPLGRLDAAEKRLAAMIQAVQIARSPLERFHDSLSDEQRQRFDAMSRGKRGLAQGSNPATMCSRQVGAVMVPVQRIAQVVEPNAQQLGAFDELKKVSENAADQLQKSCPIEVPQTPRARLDVVEQRLGAIVDAMKTIRPKLEDFYASLTDEQKAKFNTIGPPPQNASAQP